MNADCVGTKNGTQGKDDAGGDDNFLSPVNIGKHAVQSTDSGTAVAWVRNRGCRTKLEPTERNRRIFEMIARANVWLRTHTPTNPILRWSTSLWGEIPADFGRK